MPLDQAHARAPRHSRPQAKNKASGPKAHEVGDSHEAAARFSGSMALQT